MKKRVGCVLIALLSAGPVFAAWWPFGQNSKNAATNESTALSEPVPRTSPRLFRNRVEGKKPAVQPNNEKKTAAHQHSPDCNCSKPNVSTNAASREKKSFYDRSEADLQKVIQSAEAGNLKSSYIMYLYYTRHQDSVKSEQWREKTRQLAEKASPEDAMARNFLKKLNSRKIDKSVTPLATHPSQ